MIDLGTTTWARVVLDAPLHPDTSAGVHENGFTRYYGTRHGSHVHLLVAQRGKLYFYAIEVGRLAENRIIDWLIWVNSDSPQLFAVAQELFADLVMESLL